MRVLLKNAGPYGGFKSDVFPVEVEAMESTTADYADILGSELNKVAIGPAFVDSLRYPFKKDSFEISAFQRTIMKYHTPKRAKITEDGKTSEIDIIGVIDLGEDSGEYKQYRYMVFHTDRSSFFCDNVEVLV
jgi:hypothetical protein